MPDDAAAQDTNRGSGSTGTVTGTGTGTVTVSDNRHVSRYEVRSGSDLAGFAVYRLEPETVVFVHTEIEPAWEGRGLGSVLARGALDDVRAQGKHAVPLCPFIAAFIARNAEYADLVHAGHRDTARRV